MQNNLLYSFFLFNILDYLCTFFFFPVTIETTIYIYKLIVTSFIMEKNSRSIIIQYDLVFFFLKIINTKLFVLNKINTIYIFTKIK